MSLPRLKQMNMPVTFRKIEPQDNQEIARIIRNIFEEFNIPKIGTVYSDPTTDHLYTLFNDPASVYFVAEEDGVILGGSGIFPTEGLPEGCAELVKFYLSSHARGQGTGRKLMELCFEAAAKLGYRALYLESFPHLETAVGIYEKLGFRFLDHALGNSGHTACTIWMLKALNT